jgi:hypothetical protein
MRSTSLLILLSLAGCDLPTNLTTELVAVKQSGVDLTNDDVLQLQDDLAAALVRIEALEEAAQGEAITSSLDERITALEDAEGLPDDVVRTDDLTAYADTTEIERLDGLIVNASASIQPMTTTNTVIPVIDCDDLLFQLDELAGTRIIDAHVTMQLPAGTFACSDTIRVRHPDGVNIRIEGAGAASTTEVPSPASTTLTFTGVDAVELTESHVLGLLDGLTLSSTDHEGEGLKTDLGGIITAGPDLIINNFSNGVRATRNSIVYLQTPDPNGAVGSGVQILNYRNSCVHAENGATVEASFARCVGYNNTDTAGFAAHRGATINAQNSEVTTTRHAYLATYNGTVSAHLAHATDAENAFRSNYGGVINATTTETAGISLWHYYAKGNATINAADATITCGNSTGGASEGLGTAQDAGFLEFHNLFVNQPDACTWDYADPGSPFFAVDEDHSQVSPPVGP